MHVRALSLYVVNEHGSMHSRALLLYVVNEHGSMHVRSVVEGKSGVLRRRVLLQTFASKQGPTYAWALL